MTPGFSQKLRAAAQPGIIGAKKNWPPFLVLQVVALLIVIAYYQWDPFHQAMRGLAAAKLAGGLPFVFVAGALAGSVIPETAKVFAGRLKKLDGAWLKSTLFNAMVYGIVGVQVDVFYTLQGVIFGPGRDVGTLFVKTAVDMLVFAPFISIPTAMTFFEWRSGGWAKARRLFSVEGFLERIIPVMIPCWAFWIPILFCVYSMPQDLQFCLSQLAEAAWSILFIFLATDQHVEFLDPTPAP